MAPRVGVPALGVLELADLLERSAIDTHLIGRTDEAALHELAQRLEFVGDELAVAFSDSVLGHVVWGPVTLR